MIPFQRLARTGGREHRQYAQQQDGRDKWPGQSFLTRKCAGGNYLGNARPRIKASKLRVEARTLKRT
jgi:hypothetical protein